MSSYTEAKCHRCGTTEQPLGWWFRDVWCGECLRVELHGIVDYEDFKASRSSE